MTLDFYGKKIDQFEHEHERAYVGYISPLGRLVDYNGTIGLKHNNISNIVSWTFLMWIKQSTCFEDLGLIEVPMKASFDSSTGEIKNASIPESNKTNLELLKLQRDLIGFLNNMEKSPELMHKIRERIDANFIPDSVIKEKRIIPYKEATQFEIARVFGLGNTRNLLALLKDICIEYLKYDSIEKIFPNGDYIPFDGYSKSSQTYLDRPRTIFTSHGDINVRFFKYLVMDWNVIQVPEYPINPDTGLYEIEPRMAYSLHSNKDIEYAEEIRNIRRLVPLKDREKFII